ncbi:Cilia- and flagella-associated protein 157 (Flagellar-associated protein 77) [Durusdinium trenchii]|uniref:Cilia- and flagella-associated protein 157 n=1 Tax=Durusdinium trenchii TaxID=1381693 RepID=A0ABP0J6M4_9DINO
MERHDLVMQVSLLRAQLDQAQKHNVALLKTTQTLQAKIKQQETDQADVFFQLHKDLDASSDKVTALEAERDGLRSQLEAQHSHLLHEMDGVKEGASEREIALQSKVNSLTSELLELHEFSKTRKQYQLKIATLEERITQMEESHKREITDAELSKVQEKERLKKEMLVKIKETKKNLLKLTEDQLDTTTKRTMLENEQMATELFYQSREIEKLLSRLEFLEKANKVLRREVDLVNSEKLGHAKKASLYLNLSQRR